MKFLDSIKSSIYFVSEVKIIKLLQTAGFDRIARFYSAFLFGGWVAEYTGK